jgi:hypothetical protein
LSRWFNSVQVRSWSALMPSSSPGALQLATLALQHSLPAIYQFREFTAAGGLLSYGGNVPDATMTLAPPKNPPKGPYGEPMPKEAATPKVVNKAVEMMKARGRTGLAGQAGRSP